MHLTLFVIILQTFLFQVTSIPIISESKYLSQSEINEIALVIDSTINNNNNLLVPCENKNTSLSFVEWCEIQNGKNNELKTTIELVVILAKNLQDYWKENINNFDLNTVANEIGKRTFENYKLGNPICNSGLLIMIFVENAKMSVQRGNSLTVFNNFNTNKIDNKNIGSVFRPFRLEADYKNGIFAILDYIKYAINTDCSAPTIEKSSESLNTSFYVKCSLFTIVVIFLATAIYWYFRSTPKTPNMKKIDKAVAFAKSIYANDKTQIDANDCCICFEKMSLSDSGDKEVIVTGCKHIFHNGCLVKWVETKNDCPLCRKKLKIKLNYPKAEYDTNTITDSNIRILLRNLMGDLTDSESYYCQYNYCHDIRSFGIDTTHYHYHYYDDYWQPTSTTSQVSRHYSVQSSSSSGYSFIGNIAGSIIENAFTGGGGSWGDGDAGDC